MIDRPALRAVLLALALALAPGGVAAQVLYKLVDRQGQVTYSDSEPKKFDGTVTRIEPDTASNVMPSGKGAEGTTRANALSDMAGDRRRTREELEKKLHAAQARVAAARKALAEGDAPQPDEMQVIQRRYPPLARGQQAPRPNCFASRDPNGNSVLICPAQVPADAFFDRQKKLEEELRLAEEELAAAEFAYRRGTD